MPYYDRTFTLSLSFRRSHCANGVQITDHYSYTINVSIGMDGIDESSDDPNPTSSQMSIRSQELSCNMSQPFRFETMIVSSNQLRMHNSESPSFRTYKPKAYAQSSLSDVNHVDIMQYIIHRVTTSDSANHLDAIRSHSNAFSISQSINDSRTRTLTIHSYPIGLGHQ